MDNMQAKSVIKKEKDNNISYTISYYLPGSKDNYGFSVSVTHNRKGRALNHADDLLEKVQLKAIAKFAKYHHRGIRNEK